MFSKSICIARHEFYQWLRWKIYMKALLKHWCYISRLCTKSCSVAIRMSRGVDLLYLHLCFRHLYNVI